MKLKNILLINYKNMFGKKILLLAAGYIIGWAVATLYWEKKGKKVREDLDEVKGDSEKTKKLVLANFIETHKNFLDNLKERILTDENKDLFNQKIDEAKKLVKSYKKDWEALLEELKEKGEEYAETAKEKLEDMYKEKKEDIKTALEEIKSSAPEKLKENKEKLLGKFEEIKEKIKK